MRKAKAPRETTRRPQSQLVEKLDWHGGYIAGGLPDEKQNVYVALPGSYSRMWVDKYLPGVEGEDWFFVEQRR